MPASTLVLHRTQLTLRASARLERARLLACLEARGAVTVDVSAVEWMSEAYADELFGVITHYFGVSWVLDRLGVIGADEALLRTIARAISQRATALGPEAQQHRAQIARMDASRH